MSFKILDCTLRDGGYYTLWDFDEKLVDNYLDAFNNQPIDYIEIGYRSTPQKSYLGEFFYCNKDLIIDVKKKSNKKLTVLINEKDISKDDLPGVLGPCKGYIDMIRVAVNPDHFQRALKLGHHIKDMGFEVAFNMMYMSNWKDDKVLLSQLSALNGVVDYFYLVDSYGGVYPDDVRTCIENVKAYTDVKIGFHGHNNLELALVNTLVAMEAGVDILDATVTGMGRGAGNLRTELLLSVMSQKGLEGVDFNKLSKVVKDFEELKDHYRWGTNLPYMLSGVNSLPQKDVMEWVSKRYLSLNSIVTALENKKNGQADNIRRPLFNFDDTHGDVLIIGGGPKVVKHSKAILSFLDKRPDMVIIHASPKNANLFKHLKNKQIFCLIGNESDRLEQVFEGFKDFGHNCLLPPFPRKMGTSLPEAIIDQCFELSEVAFSDKFKETHTALAIQAALNFKAESIYVIGYDGYDSNDLEQRQRELFLENEALWKALKDIGLSATSLTPTLYEQLDNNSVYQFLT